MKSNGGSLLVVTVIINSIDFYCISPIPHTAALVIVPSVKDKAIDKRAELLPHPSQESYSLSLIHTHTIKFSPYPIGSDAIRAFVHSFENGCPMILRSFFD